VEVKSDINKQIFAVVSNHEGQYSIWPLGKNLPLGWIKDGTEGCKEDCLSYINQVWTDMRPLSLRDKMDS
jgi:MbtH protein